MIPTVRSKYIFAYLPVEQVRFHLMNPHTRYSTAVASQSGWVERVMRTPLLKVA
jgi:hypothetical protein